MIQTVYQTRTVCPAELRRPLPSRPAVPADAVIKANEAGARWQSEELVWASSVAALFLDAQAGCPPEAGGGE